MRIEQAILELEQLGAITYIDGDFVLSDYGRQLVKQAFGDNPPTETHEILSFLFKTANIEVT